MQVEIPSGAYNIDACWYLFVLKSCPASKDEEYKKNKAIKHYE